MEEKKSIFETLNTINVNDKVEKKGNLTYLSWAWAWGEVKKKYPSATYTIYERETDYGPVNYFTDGMTCWVKTGVTIEGLEHIEELPVMDFKNKSITLDKVTSFDVNKTIQRSLTKALARHGLGLYIYAGEDLPEEDVNKIVKDLKDMQSKMLEFGINFRSDAKIKEWVKKNTGIEPENQDVNLEDANSMKKLTKAYKTLIKRKEGKVNAK